MAAGVPSQHPVEKLILSPRGSSFFLPNRKQMGRNAPIKSGPNRIQSGAAARPDNGNLVLGQPSSFMLGQFHPQLTTAKTQQPLLTFSLCMSNAAVSLVAFPMIPNTASLATHKPTQVFQISCLEHAWILSNITILAYSCKLVARSIEFISKIGSHEARCTRL